MEQADELLLQFEGCEDELLENLVRTIHERQLLTSSNYNRQASQTGGQRDGESNTLAMYVELWTNLMNALAASSCRTLSYLVQAEIELFLEGEMADERLDAHWIPTKRLSIK